MTNSRAGKEWDTTLIKQTTTAKTTDTTLADDPELVIALGVGTYIFQIEAFMDATANGDVKFSVGFSGTSDDNLGWHRTGATTTLVWDSSEAVVTALFPNLTHMYGACVVSGAGNLSLKWAQNTSHADATSCLAGSLIRIRKVA